MANKINEAHLMSIVIDEDPKNSAITIVDPTKDGSFHLVRIIRGKEAEALYDMVMTAGEGPNDERG